MWSDAGDAQAGAAPLLSRVPPGATNLPNLVLVASLFHDLRRSGSDRSFATSSDRVASPTRSVRAQVPPARALLALLAGDVEGAADALGGLGWEDALLGRLLFALDPPRDAAPHATRVADLVVSGIDRAASTGDVLCQKQNIHDTFNMVDGERI